MRVSSSSRDAPPPPGEPGRVVVPPIPDVAPPIPGVAPPGLRLEGMLVKPELEPSGRLPTPPAVRLTSGFKSISGITPRWIRNSLAWW